MRVAHSKFVASCSQIDLRRERKRVEYEDKYRNVWLISYSGHKNNKIPHGQQSPLRVSSLRLSCHVGWWRLKVLANAFNRLNFNRLVAGHSYYAQLTVSSPPLAENVVITHCTDPQRDGQAEWPGYILGW